MRIALASALLEAPFGSRRMANAIHPRTGLYWRLIPDDG
jgi:hypothetical protein